MDNKLTAVKTVVASYDVSFKTFKEYIKPILPLLNIKPRSKFYTPSQLTLIHAHLGKP
jgi:hypothetical protein